jgi:MFS family permease
VTVRGSAGGSAGRQGRTFAAIETHRDFRYLWIGDIAFNAAQWVEFITIGWLTLDLTRSSLHSVLTVAIRAAPILLLGPWAGVLIDRGDRRRIALMAGLMSAAAALAFAVVLIVARDALRVQHIYLYMLISGIGVAIAQPSRQALVANTVPPLALANAFALNAMTVTSMRLGGTLIGGLLLETVAVHWNLLVEAGMYGATAMLLLPMGTPYRDAVPSGPASVLANLVEGLRYLIRERVVFRLNILNLTRTALFVPLLLLLPSYARDVLQAGAAVNVAMTVSMGVGGLLATWIISSFGFLIRPGLMGLVTLISGSGVIFALGLSRWMWLSIPMMIALGLSQTHFIVSNLTLIQLTVPDAFRGRMASIWYYEHGLVPIFAGGIGITAATIGLRGALVLSGVVGMVLGFVYLLWYRDIRVLDPGRTGAMPG